MNTANNTTRDSRWPKFRTSLFDLIESRPAIASTFKHSEIYFFITSCMIAFKSPGTAQAQTNLNAIADSGTFRLVEDSLRDFLALFPPAEQDSSEIEKANPAQAQQNAHPVPPAAAIAGTPKGSHQRQLPVRPRAGGPF